MRVTFREGSLLDCGQTIPRGDRTWSDKTTVVKTPERVSSLPCLTEVMASNSSESNRLMPPVFYESVEEKTCASCKFMKEGMGDPAETAYLVRYGGPGHPRPFRNLKAVNSRDVLEGFCG